MDPTSRFEILERLGYGSSGSIVYKARDLQEDKIIAIKKIPIGLLAAFPGEETTSEDVDYFVSWIVDHCIADEPAVIDPPIEEDNNNDDMFNGHPSHPTNNSGCKTPTSPTTTTTTTTTITTEGICGREGGANEDDGFDAALAETALRSMNGPDLDESPICIGQQQHQS
ncbi:hypothetical protein DFQ27_007608, partial [Actinomortierella ambigua]